MAQVAEGSLLTGFFYWNFNKNQKGIANLTVKEFDEDFRAQPNYNPNLTQFEFVSPSSYDAVWGSALALNCTETALKNAGNVNNYCWFLLHTDESMSGPPKFS